MKIDALRPSCAHLIKNPPLIKHRKLLVQEPQRFIDLLFIHLIILDPVAKPIPFQVERETQAIDHNEVRPAHALDGRQRNVWIFPESS